MKNSQCVTLLLDECAERLRLLNMPSQEGEDDAYIALVESGHTEDLWQACLDAGWTKEELGTAYRRRFK